MVWVPAARAESILKLDHAAKTKAAATPAGNKFSRAIPAKDDSDLDRSAQFLLAGKKNEQPAPINATKKKKPEPIPWDDKHAKKVNLKGLKMPKKPPKTEPVHQPSVQFAVTPTPMAPAAMVVTSVPAPQSLWAGLSLMAALAIWRWWNSRRTLPQ